ncbi:hypothetical protein JXA32_04310 [Candidatus Sumerlaeota bacterium]|nr:hypothetical protein [Candidatus Sumerlaeota bacterium]
MTQNQSRILKRKLGLARRRIYILLVCTGDTCRNPMVAGYLKKLCKDHNIRDIEIRTAGMMTVNGLLATPESLDMLRSINIEYTTHRSHPLTIEMIRKAHIIFGMTPIHVQTTLRMCEEARGKTFLLREYAGTAEGKNSQINDPMGCTLEVYKNCFKLVKKACEALVKKPLFQDMVHVPEEEKPKPIAKKAPAAKAAKQTAPKSKSASDKTAAKPAAKSASGKKKAAPKTSVKKTAVKPAKKQAAKAKKTASKDIKKKTTVKKKSAVKKAATKKTAVKKTVEKAAKKTTKKTVKSAKKKR